MSQPRTPTARLIEQLLEQGYREAAGGVLEAVTSELQSGVLAQRLDELDTEAARLDELGERLSPDNPVLLQFLRDLDTTLSAGERGIQSAAEGLTEAGVDAGSDVAQRLTVAGLPDNTIRQVGQAWNRPDPEAVAQLVDFTNDPAWGRLLTGYNEGIIERVQQRAIYGFVRGWGARRSARALRRLALGMPRSQAETIMRTLHLVSYRRSTAATHISNQAILQPVAIRVAVLDPRTCLACVALHGTEIPLGQPVRDHWQGRCTSIAQIRGMTRNITPGTVWFDNLPESRQREQRAFQNSPAAYRAYQDGAVSLQDFVSEGEDDLFGEMVFEASLVGILGDGAAQYKR